MNNQIKKEVTGIIIKFLFEVSFKSLLETDERVGDLWDNGKFSEEDFNEIIQELKSKISEQ